MSTGIAGSCLCGRVRFEASRPPRRVTHCHCDMCRRATGAVAGTFAAFESDAVRWIGEPARYDSSERAWRGFSIGNREDAAAWMEQQPYSRSLEPAYALYLMELARSDHARALELSAPMQDPSYRRNVLQAVGQNWMDKDPAAAEAWLEQADLPAELVRLVRGRSPQGQRGRIDLDR